MESTPTPTTTTPQVGVTKETYASPLVAQGSEWTKSLVQLAKTAELKKHALTLQVTTAHVLSAHASLEEKSRALQDVREQRNKLESERARLLNCLREVNEDRDKVEMAEATIAKECDDLRTKMATLTDGEYAQAKRQVDALRAELGQDPLPSLQSTLDEKAAAYLNGRRRGEEGPARKRPRGRPRKKQ